MKKVGEVVVDTRVLDKMTTEMKPKAIGIVKRYGLVITADAIIRAPIDTGYLIDTISAESQMIEDLTFRVQDGTDYGILQELGTSKMAAHPFLRPALEKYRQKFLDAFKGLFK